MTSADVIVIGAGLGGLSAARGLAGLGASVLVLEARPRVGGRVQSERLQTGDPHQDGAVVDLGAQFIGDAQTRVSALVDEAGLTRLPMHRDGANLYLRSVDARPQSTTGDRVPLSCLARLDAALMDWRINRQMRRLARSGPGRLDHTSAASFLRQLACTREAYDLVAGHFEGELCVPLDAVSPHELMMQSVAIGGRAGEAQSAQWFLAEGTGSLARHLAGQLGPRVVLDAAVRQVDQDDRGVTVQTATAQYRGSSLIVATPPQTYAAMGLLPRLPSHQQQVIADFRAGAVVKTLLVFDRAWWREHGLSGTILSPGGLCNSSLDASHPGSGVAQLVVFATAGSAGRLAASGSEQQRIARVLDWLRAVTKVRVPPPIAARSVDWNADPWSAGGYSSRRGPGGWATAPELFEPVGRIHFAGTETATEWRSFMEGALQSAERAVGEVAG